MSQMPLCEQAIDQGVVVPFVARETDAGGTGGDVDLTTFFDVSLDMLCIRDLDGTVAKVSRSWETTLGYRPDEIEGAGLMRLVHPDDMPGTLGSIVEVETRKAGAKIVGHVNRYRHKDGHYRTLEWGAQRFGDKIYAVARDVTERVAAQAALIEAKSAAEAASRAKSDFLANMSHEIRTPLNGVIGIIDALSRTPLTPEQREMVDLVRDSGVTLERLVSDILDVSKIEAGQVDVEAVVFDLDETLGGGLDVMRARALEKGLTFDVQRGETARGHFLGDSLRIRQVVGNLVSNAVKFTSVGGVRVRLDVTGEDVTGETVESTRLRVSVQDTGVGFDPSFAATLFDRFSQADSTITRRFGGTGLGLSICRSLVEMMGGEITVRSTPGVGSQFEIDLPLPRTEPLAIYDARLAEGPVVVAAMPVMTRRLRVLLAEDHPTNQKVVQLILATQDAEVVTVGDGAQALARFETEAFDVVLMDMQMPVMDGLSATRAIRDLEVRRGGTRTPLIMLSANAMAEHRQDAVEAGADLHVPKPVTADSLLAGIAAVVG